MTWMKKILHTILLSALLVQPGAIFASAPAITQLAREGNPFTIPEVTDQQSSENLTTTSKDYLLVTLEDFTFADAGDLEALKGDGEIYLYTVVTPLSLKDGQWKPNETNPGSQSNTYPYPVRLWREVPDGKTESISLPIYVSEWEKAPENLSLFINVEDNDEWPVWVSDSITGFAKGLKKLGGFLLDIANFIEDLPVKVIKKLLTKNWFVSAIAGDAFMRVLKTSKYYSDYATFKRYAKMAITLGEFINFLHSATLGADSQPDQVFEVQINTDELISPNYKLASNPKEDCRPTKTNNWCVKESYGETLSVYTVCDINYYRDEAIYKDKAKYTQGSYYLCDINKDSNITISFRKVKSPAQPIRLDMWLPRLYLIDDKESFLSATEFYFHTRLLDMNTHAIDEIPGAHEDYAKKYQFKGQTHFIGVSNRYPRPRYYPSNFYNWGTGEWKEVNALLTPHSATYITSSPFVYYELNFFEDDTGAVFEDAADWIGSTSGWINISELAEHLGEEYKKTIELKNIKFELAWIAQAYTDSTEVPQAAQARAAAEPGTLQGEKPSVYYLGFNHSAPPFNDADVRRAFAALIDREVAIEKSSYQAGLHVLPTPSLIPAQLWKTQPAERLGLNSNGIPLDEAFAREMLANAYEYGEFTSPTQFTWWPQEMRLAYIQNDLNQALAEALKQMWEDVVPDFPITLMGLSEGDFWSAMYEWSDSPELFLYAYGSELDSPHPFLADLFSDRSPYNLGGFQDPHIEWLLEEASAITDEQEQEEAYFEIERMLLEDAAVLVPLFQFDNFITPLLPAAPPNPPEEEGEPVLLGEEMTVQPDSKIAFVSNRDGDDDIYLMNADGSGLINLTNTDVGEVQPSWSPDGSQLALEVGDEIYLMDADGGNLRLLADSYGDDWYPVWSPDGSRIAFLSSRTGNVDIYVMDVDGSNARNLTNNPASEGMPVWSPDGSRIAFLSIRDGNWEIYVMDADGSNVLNLTNDPATDGWLAWSPDSSRIAFTSNRDGNWEIYVMDADGSDVFNLTNNPATDDWPTWSPDGSRIAFTSNRDGNSEIYVMDADGSNVLNLTNDPGIDDDPAWSLDGSRIAFSSNRDGNDEIYVMNLDGSGVQNLTNNPATDWAPAWQPFNE